LQHVGPLAFSFQLAKSPIQLFLQEDLVAPQFLDHLLM